MSLGQINDYKVSIRNRRKYIISWEIYQVSCTAGDKIYVHVTRTGGFRVQLISYERFCDNTLYSFYLRIQSTVKQFLGKELNAQMLKQNGE